MASNWSKTDSNEKLVAIFTREAGQSSDELPWEAAGLASLGVLGKLNTRNGSVKETPLSSVQERADEMLWPPMLRCQTGVV